MEKKDEIIRRILNEEEAKKLFRYGIDLGRHSTTSPELFDEKNVENLYRNFIKHQLE